MENEYLPCERCGKKTKRLFFLRRKKPVLLSMISFAIVVGIAFLALEEGTVRGLMLVFGGGIALMPAIALLRIRCLECEPEWKSEL